MALMDNNKKAVGIGEAVYSANPADVLVAFGLGSCLGVAFYDPQTGAGAVAHIQLPSPDCAQSGEAPGKPVRFANPGLGRFIERHFSDPAQRKRLRVYLAGASNIMDAQATFNIGALNQQAAGEILRQWGLTVTGQSTGGGGWRHLYLNLETGEAWVRTREGKTDLT